MPRRPNIHRKPIHESIYDVNGQERKSRECESCKELMDPRTKSWVKKCYKCYSGLKIDDLHSDSE